MAKMIVVEDNKREEQRKRESEPALHFTMKYIQGAPSSSQSFTSHIEDYSRLTEVTRRA